jgi:hypothetical protein
VALHLPNFRMLEAGPMVGRLAAVPLLISRRRTRSCAIPCAAARASAAGAKWLWWQRVIAGLWSLMSGTVVVMALEALLSV